MYWIGVQFTDCHTQIDVILWRRDLNWNCFTSTQTQIFTLFRPMCHLNTFTQTDAITFPSYYGNFAVKFSSFRRRYWMNNRDWDRERERESFVIKISFLRFTVLSSFISLFRVISCKMHQSLDPKSFETFGIQPQWDEMHLLKWTSLKSILWLILFSLSFCHCLSFLLVTIYFSIHKIIFGPTQNVESVIYEMNYMAEGRRRRWVENLY